MGGLSDQRTKPRTWIRICHDPYAENKQAYQNKVEESVCDHRHLDRRSAPAVGLRTYARRLDDNGVAIRFQPFVRLPYFCKPSFGGSPNPGIVDRTIRIPRAHLKPKGLPYVRDAGPGVEVQYSEVLYGTL